MKTDKPPDADENNQNAPAPLTAEELDKKLGTTVNNMLTARMSTMGKQLTESISKSFDEKLKSFEEKFSQRPPKKDEADEPDDKGGGKGGKRDAELATLKAQVESLRKVNEEQAARSAALEMRAREAAMRDRVASILSNAGITGHHFTGAFATLVQQGRLKVLVDDPVLGTEPFLYVDHSTGTELALEVGLDQWLKNDPMAKIFLPPSGVRGSGSQPSRGGSPPGKPVTDEDRRRIVAMRLESELGR